MTKLWIVFCVVLVAAAAVSAVPDSWRVRAFNDVLDNVINVISTVRYTSVAKIKKDIRDIDDLEFWLPRRKMDNETELKLENGCFYLDESIREVDDLRCKKFLLKFTKEPIKRCTWFLLHLVKFDAEDVNSKGNSVLEYLRRRKIDLGSKRNGFGVEFDEATYGEQMEEIRKIGKATERQMANILSRAERKTSDFVKELGSCLVFQADRNLVLSREWYDTCGYYTKA